MRSIGLTSGLLLLALSLTGCGQSGPKHVPLRVPSKPVAELPADEVETVEVELDFEKNAPAEGDAVPADAAKDEGAPATDTAASSAPSENAPGATPETPAEPQKPRPSVFLKLLAQPVQDAMQANMESVTEGAGGFLPSP